MMYEELYLITDSGREKLDLNTPSDITLEYVNNLFNDLSKIEASHSYTFKLPCTANNKRLLDYADDVRHTSALVKQNGKAEYIVDGVQLFSDANLYVSGFEDGFFEVVMTWGVIEGLKKIQDNDISINELGKYLNEGEYDYKGDEDSDYETDKVFTDGEFTKYVDWENDTNIPSYYQTVHAAGVSPFVIPNSSTSAFRLKRSFTPWVHENTGAISVGVCNIADCYENGVVGEENDGVYRCAIPYAPVVMPVAYLMKTIGNHYGLTFNIPSDQLKKYCIPLIKREPTDALTRLNYLEVSLSGDGDNPNLAVGVTNIYSSINPVSAEGYDADRGTDIGLSSCKWIKLGENDNIDRSGELKLDIDGYIKINTSDTDVVDVTSPDDYPKLQVVSLSDDGKETQIVIAESQASDLERVSSPTGWYRYHTFTFDFRNSEGQEHLTTSPILSRYFRIRIVTKDGNSFDISSYEGTLKLYYKYSNNSHSISSNLFANLPDISCSDFIKSIYYLLGGYPVCIHENIIDLILYKSLNSNLKGLDIIDWSSLVIYSEYAQLGFSKDSLSSSSSLAKKNYYLMKNDELTSLGIETPNKDLEDAYQHGYAHIDINIPELDDIATIYTFPFYGGFLKNGKQPRAETGATQDLWKTSEKSLGVFIYNASEAKPIIGVFKSQDSIIYKLTVEKDTDRGEHTQTVSTDIVGDGDAYLSLDAWCLSGSLTDDDNYGFMTKIFNNPCLVTETMRISPIDLADLDYTKPIYIEKYNSMFVLKKLQFSPSTGLSKVELLKIPADVTT